MKSGNKGANEMFLITCQNKIINIRQKIYDATVTFKNKYGGVDSTANKIIMFEKGIEALKP